MPLYADVRSHILMTHRNDRYVRSFLKEIGMVDFEEESSSDPLAEGSGTKKTIGRSTRAKSIKASSMRQFLGKKQLRSASGWFKETLASGKKRKCYCEMLGAEIVVQEKLKKVLTVKETIKITNQSSIQSHGYNLFIVNPDRRWQLAAESEEVCQSWYKNLRATFIEICETIDVNAFANQEPEPAALPAAPAGVFGPGPGVAKGAAVDADAERAKAKVDATAAAAAAAAAEKEAAAKAAVEGEPTADGAGGGGGGGGAAAPAAPAEELSPEAAAAAKAEKRAAAKAKMAAKRAAAKAERADNVEAQLKEIFGWIDALVIEDDAPSVAGSGSIIASKLSAGEITAEEAKDAEVVETIKLNT